MQLFEYMQISLALVGLALITWTKVSFTQRQQFDVTIHEWTPRETVVRRAAWVCIGIALVFVFVPF